MRDPWTVVDGYDDRSWIENGLFRNSKQFWRLTRWFPQKTEAGVQSHLTFVVMVLAVATAYRLWDKAQAGVVVAAPDHQITQVVHTVIDAQTGAVSVTPEPKPARRTHLASRLEPVTTPPAQPTVPVWSHEQLEGESPLRWRRRLRRVNRDLVIVFVGQHYGIFHASELLVLSGVPVREAAAASRLAGGCPASVWLSARYLIPQSVMRSRLRIRYVYYTETPDTTTALHTRTGAERVEAPVLTWQTTAFRRAQGSFVENAVVVLSTRR